MSTLLVCTSVDDAPAETAVQTARVQTAAVAAGLQVEICTSVEQARRAAHVRGVVAVGRRAAPLTARAAALHGLPWHSAQAVDVTSHRLRLLGRLTAARVPAPRYASVDVHTGEGVERLVGLPFPCRVTWPARGLSAQAADVEALRARAMRWSGEDLDSEAFTTGSARADTRLVIETTFDGPIWWLVGLLDAGALRVISSVEGRPAGPEPDLVVLVSPSSLARDALAHLAGAVAQACAAVGLTHGPVLAEWRGVATAMTLVDLAPTTFEGPRADVLPLVTPARAACSLEDVVLRHALGLSLDGYAHEGTYSGVHIRATDVPVASARGDSADEVYRQLLPQPLSGT